jgi:hypothetical protein
MSCGEPASATKTKQMSWCPPWVGVLILAGLLPYVIVASIMTQRARIQAPLCDQHQGHWFNRNALMWGSFFLLGLVGAGLIALVSTLPRQNPNDDSLFGIACLGSVVLFVVWVIIAIVCQNTAIRPTEITPTHITLTGVSDGFVDAVEDAKAEHRSRKRSRISRREDDEEEEEEERPRKKRPPSDAIEE